MIVEGAAALAMAPLKPGMKALAAEAMAQLALALGAAGVNMGTRFMATAEAPIHAKIKQAPQLVQLGEQFCCGVTHALLPHCWGMLPPHRGLRLPREDTNPQGSRTVSVPHGYFAPLDEPNYTVVHVRNRRRIQRARYLRDFGLKVPLDQPQPQPEPEPEPQP